MKEENEKTEASTWKKFRLLMWKNALLQWRHPVQTAAELLIPLLSMSLVLILRSQTVPYLEGESEYRKIPAYGLSYSGSVIIGMRPTSDYRLGIAYSPRNELLEDIVRTSYAYMLAENLEEIKPILEELGFNFTNFDYDNINKDVVVAAIKVFVKADAYDEAVDLRRVYAEENSTKTIIAAIEFPDDFSNITELPEDMRYSLRFPERPRMNSFYSIGGRSWRTTLVFPTWPTPGPRFPYSYEGGNDPGYINEMFIALQHSISMEIISRMTNPDVKDFIVSLHRYSHAPFHLDWGVQILRMMFGMFIMLSFSYTAINITRAVALEKELQLKEAMKIIGLPTYLHWTAWFCKQFIISIILSLFTTIIVKIKFFVSGDGTNTYYGVINETHWSIVFFFLIIFLSSATCLCFMISSFFSKASTAALFMGIGWFMLYIPSVLLSTDDSLSRSVQLLACLSVNTAMNYGFQLIFNDEIVGGLRWKDFFYTANENDNNLQFGQVVIMIIVDGILYMLVALYLEQVRPGPLGVPQPWYFPFTKTFWCGYSKSDLTEETDVNGIIENNIVQEEERKHQNAGIKIVNLTKKFGQHTAVKNLNLNIYDDQITILLGHNGAGKSTTISMLTGNTVPSKGAIWISGYNLKTNLRDARNMIGFCPQHNVLFPELTVKEHVQFFAELKGYTGVKLENEIDMLVSKLELDDKRDYKSEGLSGGQKRRLSVGIALCADSKVVLLDEPTSGMDPASRRALWDLLQREKKGRSMILTTHFMDEADYLGDRIAIMADGGLQCVGSPYFLKKRFGVGYTLVVVKRPEFDSEICTQVIDKYIPGARMKENKGSEVTYSLPNEMSHLFQQILLDLESNREAIGFVNYGLTATTMEDVFMSIGSDTTTNDNSNASLSSLVTNETAEFNNRSQEELCSIDSEATLNESLKKAEPTVSGTKLQWQHIFAIWYKLWLVWTRSWGLLLLQLLVPIIIMNTSLFILVVLENLEEQTVARYLTLSRGFDQTKTLISSDASFDTATNLAYHYKSLFDNETAIIKDVGNQSVNDYFLDRSYDKKAITEVRHKMFVGVDFTDFDIIGWFSNYGYHDRAITLANIHRALLKLFNPNADLNVANHPLNTNYKDNRDQRLMASLQSQQFSNGLGQSVTIVSAVFIMFYIRERVLRAKLLQKAAGVEPYVMWGSAWVFDFIWFMLISLTYLLSSLVFQVSGLNTAAELGRLYVCLMVYGVSMLPFTYLVSFFFQKPALGFVALVFANSILGTMLSQIVDALRLAKVQVAPEVLDVTMMFFPLYSLTSATRQLHEQRLLQLGCAQICEIAVNALPTMRECSAEVMCEMSPNNCCLRESPYFEWEQPGVLRYLLAMLTTAAVSWLLVICIEHQVFAKLFEQRKRPPPLDQSKLDEDVYQEIKHVEHISDLESKKYNLVAKQLSKYYSKNLAVNQISFSVADSECFGLLGVNGAGKTTTFKMLMGDEPISHGDAFVKGYSVSSNMNEMHKHIGYCPQFEALFEELTGRETLRFYALLRGLESEAISELTSSLAGSLGFTKHLDKRVSNYSGGNKRKLSAAVALMGNTKIIFLDEPTTGVDPAAKRQVWKAITNVTKSGRSVILTSHSMEECEALCSRLTIMVNGQFMCLGTPQHLKNKFSQGFTLIVKLKKESAHRIDELKTFICTEFSNPVLKEEHFGLLTYYLPQRNVAWSDMFGIMERAKIEMNVEDYSIAQTTLEQIFLQFTKYQEER